MVNCKIMGNSVEEDGAGSSGVGGKGYSLTNCVIAGNSGGGAVVGGGMWSSDLVLECSLSNCVIARNSGNGCELGSGSTLTNCILWNSGKEIIGPAEVSYSCVEGGWPGVGNIDADPRFVRLWNGEAGDFQLLPDSPCIDAGNPDPSYNDACTPPGLGTERCDMGAYGGRGNCGWAEESGLPTIIRPWMLY